MKCKIISALIVAITGFSVPKSYAQELVTLQQAVDRALSNNLQIKQAQFNAAISDENLTQSKYALYPSLNGSANFNKNFGRSIDPSTNQYISQQFESSSGNLTASADLFNGFIKVNQIKQNKLLLDANKSALEKIKNNLILQVVTAYMQILYSRDLLIASKGQLSVAEKTYERQKSLLDVGNITLADVSQSKSQVATAQLNVTNSNNNLNLSYLNLNQLMEQPVDQNFEVQIPLTNSQEALSNSSDINTVIQSALQNFPDIKESIFRTQAAEKAVDIARGSFYPRLSIGSGLGTNYSSGRSTIVGVTPDGFNEIGRTQITNEAVVVPRYITQFQKQTFSTQIKDNFNQFVGLNLSIPIFNGFMSRSNFRRAKITLENTRVQEQLIKNNLSKVISQAVYDLRAAESKFQSTKNAFDAQKDAFFVVEQRYNVGLINSVDYNTAETNKNKAEIDFLQAKYDLLFKAKVIDYYLGKPITF